MADNNLREVIKSEYKKCSLNAVYFIKKYVLIQHPTRGRIPFKLFPYQEETLKEFQENSKNIVLKSRQMGISTLCAAYILWLMVFHTDKNCLIISKTQDAAKEVVTKVRFGNDNLPSWLKVEAVEDNRLSLRLKNGSQVKSVSSSKDSARSGAISLLIMDECVSGESIISVRNKVTGEIKKIKIEDLYNIDEYAGSVVDKKNKKVDGFEIMTPIGWSNFFGVSCVEKENYIQIKFSNGTELKCSENHKLKLAFNESFIYSKDVSIGTLIESNTGQEKVIGIANVYEKIKLYDVLSVELGARYYTNGLVSSNCAFMEYAEDIWLAAQPTLSTGGHVVALSTPNGTGNWFHKMWVDGEANKNGFNTIRLKWNLHPERDQNWRDEQTKNLGVRESAQECFDGDTRIYTDHGLIPIKNVKVGMNVLTHSGKFKSIVNVMCSKSNNTCEFYSSINRRRSIVTKNHPFLTTDNKWKTIDEIQDMSKVCNLPVNINTDKFKRNISIDLFDIIKPNYFKLVKSKCENMVYVNDRKHKIHHNRFVDVDYDFGFMIGLYLSEGWLEDNRVYFAFNWETELNDWPNKLEKIIKEKIGNCRISYRKTAKNGGQMMVNSQIFSKLLSLLCDGELCYDKTLSKFSYDILNIESFNGILDGSFIGDGMILDKYNKQFSSRSINYMYDIKFILSICKHTQVSTFTNKTNSSDVNVIKLIGTTGLHCDDRLLSKMELPIKRQNCHIIEAGESYIQSTIYKTKDFESTEIDVYNLTVDDDHTYVTEHFIVHNCDTDFSTSGNTVIKADDITFHETLVKTPIEKRGSGEELWIWQRPDYTRRYLVSADVARGDGTDFNAFHVLDIETMEQVAEYEGRMSTKDYGNFLVSISTEYNNALLVIENNSYGWATIQQVIDRRYDNLFYSSDDLLYIDVESQMTNKINQQEKKMTPGFATTSKSRPLVIAKLELYLSQKEVSINSIRLLEQLRTFIWRGAKAEAAGGYNDDIIMSYGIALWIRDTALKLLVQSTELNRVMLGGIGKSQTDANSAPKFGGVYKSDTSPSKNPWEMRMNGRSEDLTWLIR